MRPGQRPSAGGASSSASPEASAARALAYLGAQDLGRGSRLVAAEGPGDRPTDLQPRTPHFAAKARSVIHLFMNGGPSQMDLFDPKPTLDKHHGQAYVDKIAGEVEFIKDAGALMRSPFQFARHGQCGAWVSEVLPHPCRGCGRPRLHSPRCTRPT